MSKAMNPYGVNMSPHEDIEHWRACECCAMRFSFIAPRNQPLARRRCDYCTGHALDGSDAERVEALWDHVARWQEYAERAAELTRRAHEARAKAETEATDRRRATAAALETRDQYRAVYQAVMELHQPGMDDRCQCGEQSCPEREAAERTWRIYGSAREDWL